MKKSLKSQRGLKFEESCKIDFLLKKAEQLKTLQDLVHVPSQYESEIVRILHEGFQVFGLNYQEFIEQELDIHHPDELVWVGFESTAMVEVLRLAELELEAAMKKRTSFDYFRDAIQYCRMQRFDIYYNIEMNLHYVMSV